MARIAYFAVLMVALGSVAFGLDWVSAPMSPMPDVKFAAQTPSAPPRSPTDNPNAVPSPIAPVGPGSLSTATPPVNAGSLPAARNRTVGAVVTDPSSLSGGGAPQHLCNVDACASAYHSFQALDCTYQPTNGPRRRCTKK